VQLISSANLTNYLAAVPLCPAGAALGQRVEFFRFSFPFQVREYLLESLSRERGPAHERSECFGCSERFGYVLGSATACFTDRNIDIEYPLEAFCLYALGCRSSRHAALPVIFHRRLPGVCHSCLVSRESPEPGACYWDGPAPRRTRHGSVSDWLAAWVSGPPGVP
jgi:hypothetical protein